MNKALLWVAVGVGVLVLLSRRAMAAPAPDTTAGSGPPTMMSGMDKTISGLKAAGPIVKTLRKPAFTSQKSLSSNVPTSEVAVEPGPDVGKILADLANQAKSGMEWLLSVINTGQELADKAEDLGLDVDGNPFNG